MKLINVTISQVDGADMKCVNLNQADSNGSEADDKTAVLTRDDLDAGEQATFDAFFALMESKIPA